MEILIGINLAEEIGTDSNKIRCFGSESASDFGKTNLGQTPHTQRTESHCG